MSWKGSLRSIQAAERRREREQKRRYNEAIRQEKELAKLQESDRAAYEAEVYEAYIELITSVHKESSDTIQWEAILNQPPPVQPSLSDTHTVAAQKVVEAYKPSTMDRLLRKSDAKLAELQNEVRLAEERDLAEFKAAQLDYVRDHSDWEEQRALAQRIVQGDVKAFQEAVDVFDPLGELTQLGVTVRIDSLNSDFADIVVNVAGDQLVPKQIKTQLKSGKLSIKDMPKSQYFSVYQDYVCGTVLRVAREMLATIPIQRVYVTAETGLLNSATGHIEPTPIISAVIVRETVKLLNFDTLDPSDAFQNFVHRMNFKKTSGFGMVKRIMPGQKQ